jgi:hypothetical protein
MVDRIEPSTSSIQRLVRVFVSSTFRDVQGGRDELAKITCTNRGKREAWHEDRAMETSTIDKSTV